MLHKNIKWKNSDDELFKELSKLTVRQQIQSETMKEVNRKRKEDNLYKDIQKKSMQNRNQSDALHTRWANADEETRKNNMNVARYKAYDNAAKRREERNQKVYNAIQTNDWFSRKKMSEWLFNESGLAEEWGLKSTEFFTSVISNKDLFERKGNNSRWMKFRKKIAK